MEEYISDELMNEAAGGSQATGALVRTRYTLRFLDDEVEDTYQVFFFRRFSRELSRVYLIVLAIGALLTLPIIMEKGFERPLSLYIFFFIPATPCVILAWRGAATGGQTWFYNAQSLPGVSMTIACAAGWAPIVQNVVVKQILDPYVLPIEILVLAAIGSFGRLPYRYNVTFCALTSIFFLVGYAAVGFAQLDLGVVDMFQAVILVVASAYIFAFVARSAEVTLRTDFYRAYELTRANKALQTEVEELRQERDSKKRAALNLASPLERAITSLKFIMNDKSLARSHKVGIERALEVISSANARAPQLLQEIRLGRSSVDEDTRRWLFSEMAQGMASPPEAQRRYSRAPSMRSARSHASQLLMSVPEATPATLSAWLPEEEAFFNSYMMPNIGSIDFDVFKARDAFPSRVLATTMHCVFASADYYERFPYVDVAKLHRFAQAIESLYKPNPYHNSMHAADVLQTFHFLCQSSKLKEFLSDVELLAALVAICVHDVAHPGLNNSFQTATGSKLALTYNDRSVLENYHASTAFSILRRDDCAFLTDEMPLTDRKLFRSTVIELILATDMSVHFAVVSEFKTMVASRTLNPDDAHDRLKVLTLMVKSSDISNVAKPTPIYLRWADLVVEEFYVQGDREREVGLPVSTFMDRENPQMAKSQVGFIDFVCKPLYEALSEVDPTLPFLDNVETNRTRWE